MVSSFSAGIFTDPYTAIFVAVNNLHTTPLFIANYRPT